MNEHLATLYPVQTFGVSISELKVFLRGQLVLLFCKDTFNLTKVTRYWSKVTKHVSLLDDDLYNTQSCDSAEFDWLYPVHETNVRQSFHLTVLDFQL